MSTADTNAYADPIDADVVILAGPAGTHVPLARAFLGRNQHVVSVSDDITEVKSLLDLDIEARERNVAVVVGAAFCPGLTCVLASHAAARFDVVDEVHVASAGTAGRPAPVSTTGRSAEWRSIGVKAAGSSARLGSGRELCWFPDPMGAQDCYRAALPDALLLVPAFGGVTRVTSRVAATRRDRLTAGLPMLWPTHPEGGPARCASRYVAIGTGRTMWSSTAPSIGPRSRRVQSPRWRRCGPPKVAYVDPARAAWRSWPSPARSSASWRDEVSAPRCSRATPHPSPEPPVVSRTPPRCPILGRSTHTLVTVGGRVE